MAVEVDSPPVLLDQCAIVLRLQCAKPLHPLRILGKQHCSVAVRRDEDGEMSRKGIDHAGRSWVFKCGRGVDGQCGAGERLCNIRLCKVAAISHYWDNLGRSFHCGGM
ncbi:hypothetical protein D3C71_1255760 [compost metagenome]